MDWWQMEEVINLSNILQMVFGDNYTVANVIKIQRKENGTLTGGGYL